MVGAGLRPADSPRFQFAQQLARRRNIELVLQAGAPRLEQNGEVLEARNRIEQLLRTQTAHPQRHALVEAPSGQKQRPLGAGAEAGAEKPRALQTLLQKGFEAGGRDHGEQFLRFEIVRQEDAYAVVGGEHLEMLAKTIFPGGVQRHGIGSVNASTPQCVQDDLIARITARPGARALDDDMVAVGQ